MRTKSNDHFDFRRKGLISLIPDDGRRRSQKEGSARKISASQVIRTSHQKTRRFCLDTHISDMKNDEGNGSVQKNDCVSVSTKGSKLLQT